MTFMHTLLGSTLAIDCHTVMTYTRSLRHYLAFVMSAVISQLVGLLLPFYEHVSTQSAGVEGSNHSYIGMTRLNRIAYMCLQSETT